MTLNKTTFVSFFESQKSFTKKQSNSFKLKKLKKDSRIAGTVFNFKYTNFSAYPERETLYANNYVYNLQSKESLLPQIFFYKFLNIYSLKGNISPNVAEHQITDVFIYYFYQQVSLFTFIKSNKLVYNNIPSTFFSQLYFFFLNCKKHKMDTRRNCFFYKRRVSSFSSTFYPLSSYFTNFFFSGLVGAKKITNQNTKSSYLTLISPRFVRRLQSRRHRFVSKSNFIKNLVQKKINFKANKKVSNFIFFDKFSKKKLFFYSLSRPYFQVAKKSKFRKSNVIIKQIGEKVSSKVNTPFNFHVKLLPETVQEHQSNFSEIGQLKNLLSLRVGSHFSIFKVNAIAFARYAFDQERIITYTKTSTVQSNEKAEQTLRLKSSQRFLFNLERERFSRFRYVAVYIQDLVRITFFTIYLKKAYFLVSFVAFTLAKLPRNRKETQFLRFIIKLVKIFASQRKEVLGVRLRFQGRVNRWRRTKHVIGENGMISFYSYCSRIDYGMSQAITRKGALGIRLWLAYLPYFRKNLQQAIFAYSRLN